MNKHHPATATIIAAFAIIYCVWGTTYLAMGIGLETIPPFILGAVRFTLAGIATFIVLRVSGVTHPTVKQLGSAALVGVMMIVGGNGMVLLAIKNGLPTGIAAVIVATMPLWMTLFDWLFYRGPQPTAQIVFGLVLGFLGIVLLVDPIGSLQGEASLSLTGILICVLAPMFWALGSLQSRKMELPSNVFMSVALQMFCGGVAFLLISLSMGELWTIEYSKISVRSSVAVLYLSVFGSIVALTAYMWLLKHVPATRVSTYTYVNPIIAVVLGWLILNEMISTRTMIAIVIVVSAVVLIVTRRQSPSVKPQHALNASAADEQALAK